MAATDVTRAQLDTEIGAIKTALRAEDWDTAHREWACACATAAGLADSLATSGRSLHYRQELNLLGEVIARARAAAAVSASRSRLVFGKTCYNGRQQS